MEYKNNLLRLPKVIQRTGYRRSTIYEKIALGTFPSPVHLGPRAVAWLSLEIDQWIDDRIHERDQSLIKESSIGQ